jgi:hypothetical protein
VHVHQEPSASLWGSTSLDPWYAASRRRAWGIMAWYLRAEVPRKTAGRLTTALQGRVRHGRPSGKQVVSDTSPAPLDTSIPTRHNLYDQSCRIRCVYAEVKTRALWTGGSSRCGCRTSMIVKGWLRHAMPGDCFPHTSGTVVSVRVLWWRC